jgi:hypothetical protein
LMAIATRPFCNQPTASISISILPIHQIHLLVVTESLAAPKTSDPAQCESPKS